MGCAGSKGAAAQQPGGAKESHATHKINDTHHAKGKARRLSVATGAMDMEEVENATELEDGSPAGGTGSDGPAWLVYAAASNAGCSAPGIKKKNQDSCLIVPTFKGQRHQLFFGVFDGHGQTGHFASQKIKQDIPGLFAAKFEANGVADVGEGNLASKKDAVTKAFKESFASMDQVLADCNIDVMLSGSTAVVVYMCGKEVACANAGDSRAVMGSREGSKGPYTHTDFSTDQKPEDPLEKTRIEGMGGVVRQLYDEEYSEYVGPHRVWSKEYNCEAPGIAMARSLGDQLAADCGVICDPEVKYFTMDTGPSGKDKFFIVASDGVWEFIDSQEGVDIVGREKDAGKTAKECANTLARISLERWQAEEDVVDDITAIVGFLDTTEE